MSVAQQAYTAGLVTGVAMAVLTLTLVVAVAMAMATERHRLLWAATVAANAAILGRLTAVWWPQ